jgi:hypothetical protein
MATYDEDLLVQLTFRLTAMSPGSPDITTTGRSGDRQRLPPDIPTQA